MALGYTYRAGRRETPLNKSKRVLFIVQIRDERTSRASSPFLFSRKVHVSFRAQRLLCIDNALKNPFLFTPSFFFETNETHPIEGLNRLNEKNRRRIRGDCHAGNSRTAVENNFLFYFPLYEDGRGSNGKGVAVSRHQFFRKKCRDTWPPPPCERAGRGSSPRKRYVLWFYNANG